MRIKARYLVGNFSLKARYNGHRNDHYSYSNGYAPNGNVHNGSGKTFGIIFVSEDATGYK